jgi:post-segregation antitoxin (ccd killing protein)
VKQNITVTLDKETIRKAKVVAAARSTSVSRLLAAEIERLVAEHDRYEEAKKAAIAELRRGYDLGGGPLPRRGEAYDR